jgi:hypothetical protein
VGVVKEDKVRLVGIIEFGVRVECPGGLAGL